MRSEGEEAFAQGFQFAPFVPVSEQDDLRDFLYKFAHNFAEAKEYLQILKQADSIDTNVKSELFFRIQAMALQCVPLAMRRLSDDSSKRSSKRLIKKVLRDEFQPGELEKIDQVHSHYKQYLNTGVAHQDELSVHEALQAFPDTEVIDADLKTLEDLYYKIVKEICTGYIGISFNPKNYLPELKKLTVGP